jgi:hypothetical protein
MDENVTVVDIQDITWLGWHAALLHGWQKTFPRESVMYAALEQALECFIADSPDEAIRQYSEYAAWLADEGTNPAYVDAVSTVAGVLSK